MFNNPEEDKRFLLHFDSWNTMGIIRRKQRQLLRAFAVRGRKDYGQNSIEAYCDYISRMEKYNV